MHVLMRGLCGVMVAAGMIGMVGCHQSSKQKTAAGTVQVESMKMTAKVQAIDYNNRLITLQMPNGNMRTYKVSKDVVNFDQIRPNDRVTVTAVQSVAVSVLPPGSPAPVANGSTTVTLAPKGAKPGMVVTDTTNTSARIVSIDHWNHKVTLQMPSGMQQTVQVSPRVDLSHLKKGDDVVIKRTDDLAISVESP